MDGNDLAALDLSANTELESLYCSENEIASLDVSMLPKLINLGCGDNALTELDLHANKDLRFLDCSSNKLTEIDLSANAALQTLYVIGNPMTTLDVSMLPELRVLECYDMPLETLTLGKLQKLSRFACYWMNEDLLLDFTGCPILIDAYKNGNRKVTIITEGAFLAEYKSAPLGGVLELDVDPLVLGDLNGDGTISALDLLQMRKALVGIPEEDLIPAAADLNRTASWTSWIWCASASSWPADQKTKSEADALPRQALRHAFSLPLSPIKGPPGASRFRGALQWIPSRRIRQDLNFSPSPRVTQARRLQDR